MRSTIKKCFDNWDDVYLTLMQMGSTPIGKGLPGPGTLLFNRPIRALLPQINWQPMNSSADDEYYVLKC